MERPARLVVLLPPSEGKAPGGAGPAWGEPSTDAEARGEFPVLDPHRRTVARGLTAGLRNRRLDNATLLGVGGPALAAGVAAGLAVTEAPTRPAMERYTGVLYRALSYSSLSKAARARADGDLVIISGLWGLVAPTDEIPDYKLPIGAALPRLGRLATWWRPRLSPVLDERVDGAVVWDLLPGAHAAAWGDGGRAAARWRVRVLREGADGRRTPVSHDSKTVKGALARHLVRLDPAQCVDPRELGDVELPGGYRLDVATSVLGAAGGVVDLVAPAGQ